MKKNLLLALSALLILFIGCKKDSEDSMGSVSITMSYYYNTFQGYKPDVDASAFLFKDTGTEYEKTFIDYKIGYLHKKGTEQTVRPDYTATADVSGKATFDGVKYGKYLLVVSSNGRFVYSTKMIEVNSPEISLVKNFGHLNEFKDTGEAW